MSRKPHGKPLPSLTSDRIQGESRRGGFLLARRPFESVSRTRSSHPLPDRRYNTMHVADSHATTSSHQLCPRAQCHLIECQAPDLLSSSRATLEASCFLVHGGLSTRCVVHGSQLTRLRQMSNDKNKDESPSSIMVDKAIRTSAGRSLDPWGISPVPESMSPRQ